MTYSLIKEMSRVLQMLVVLGLNSGFESFCLPAEEGKIYVLKGSFNHTLNGKLEVLWRRNETFVSHCKNLRCIDVDTAQTITTLSSINNNGYQFRLSIRSFTRRDSTLWFIKYFGDASLIYKEPLFKCYLNIFAKGTNASCQENIKNEMLKVSSRIFDVYPSPQSIFYMKSQDNSSAPSEIFMNCTHTETRKDQQIYFTSVCEAEIHIHLLRNWDGGFVTMYPNVTGQIEDRTLGVNISLKKYTNLPVLNLDNCPHIVVEETEVRCQCKAKDTLSNIKLAWYEVGNKTLLPGSNVLSYVAMIRNKEYVCHGTHILGKSSLPIFYRPKVIAKWDSLKCATHNEDDWIQIICNVSRIYPEGICQTTILRNDINYVNENYQTKTTNIFNEIHYSTQCTLNVPNDKFLHGNYSITVIVYPNITGNDSDKIYGVNQTVYVHYPERRLSYAEEDMQTSTDLQPLIGPISLGAIAFILMVILTSLFVCYRKKMCVLNKISQVSIICNRKKIQTTRRNISHIYESVEDVTVNVAPHSQQKETYVNSEAIAKDLACRQQLLDKDYITPSEIRISYQKISHSNNTHIVLSFDNQTFEERT